MGDLRDRVSLDVACTGIEVVVTTANTALRGGEDSVRTVDLGGNRNLIGSWHRGSPVPGVDEGLLGLLAGMDMYGFVLDMSKLSRTFGIEPTPLEVIVGQVFGGAGL